MTGARRPPRRRRYPIAKVVIAVLAAAVVFGLGVALGKVLDDGADTSTVVTRVRTLKPLPLAPALETVTVTVGG